MDDWDFLEDEVSDVEDCEAELQEVTESLKIGMNARKEREKTEKDVEGKDVAGFYNFQKN